MFLIYSKKTKIIPDRTKHKTIFNLLTTKFITALQTHTTNFFNSDGTQTLQISLQIFVPNIPLISENLRKIWSDMLQDTTVQNLLLTVLSLEHNVALTFPY